MTRLPLHVAAFGGGVVLEGAADTRKIDEVLQADAIDIGPRGALIATSDVTPYVVLNDGAAVPARWTNLFGVYSMMPGSGFVPMLAVGQGTGRIDSMSPYGVTYVWRTFDREGDASPVTGATNFGIFNVAPSTNAPSPIIANGIITTLAVWPGVFQLPTSGTQLWNLAFVNLGMREGFGPYYFAVGLWAIGQIVGTPGVVAFPISKFNSLGTGALGDGVTPGDVGTSAKQLYFRGIVSWNDFLFGWGFDSSAGGAALYDGPNRVMFCNLGMPLKWGNDNVAPSGDRVFTDSDAIVLGDAGEIIRGALKWNGKLWFGTNQQMHYIAGYGRDSFLSDGATPVTKAYNIVGPHALIEGPDRAMYGVSDQGLWRTADGVTFDALFRKLVDFAGHSAGYWDLIWTDLTRTQNAYPGQTNQDLIWMASDLDRRQVVVGIPFCNTTEGFGAGADTVLIKYHVDTGGFTRQVFPMQLYTQAAFLRGEGLQRPLDFLGVSQGNIDTILYYGFKANEGSSPVLPTVLPTVTMGYYAPFGPDGRGQLKRLYLTVAWESAAALPLSWQVTPMVDQVASDTFVLTISPTAPVAPTVNDLWLDTSWTDTNLGNGTAGTITPAFPEALLNIWASSGFWRRLGGIGTNGTRATIRLPLNPRSGTRISMTFATLSASGRFQFEALGEAAGPGEVAA